MTMARPEMSQIARRRRIIVFPSAHFCVSNVWQCLRVGQAAYLKDFDHHYNATPGVKYGEELWQQLIRKHAFIMVLNEHAIGDGTTVQVSTYWPFYDFYLTAADQSYSFTMDWPAVPSGS
jgi:hypothetical protein